uniref:Uncharacterized protein n=1 Tax=Felis catus TaxID=9685 RepID=A0ABI7Z1X4_FELCA
MNIRGGSTILAHVFSLTLALAQQPIPRLCCAPLELLCASLSPAPGWRACADRNFGNINLRLCPSLIAALMEDGNKPNDVRLPGRHVQPPVQSPKDFFSVILEKESLSAMRSLATVKPEPPEMLRRRPGSCGCASGHGMKNHGDPEHPGRRREGWRLYRTRPGTSGDDLDTKGEEGAGGDLEAARKYRAFGLPVCLAHLDGQSHVLLGSAWMEHWDTATAEAQGPTWSGHFTNCSGCNFPHFQ